MRQNRVRRDDAEPAGLVVEHRLLQLGAGVHDERAIRRDGLADRLAAEEQDLERRVARVLLSGRSDDQVVALPEDGELAGANRGNPSLKTGRGEDYALIASVDISPTKGLDIKPLFSWFHADGQTSGTARRNLVNRNTAGGTLNATAARGAPTYPSAAGSPSYHQNRYTVGADARWRIGGFAACISRSPTTTRACGQRPPRCSAPPIGAAGGMG